VAEPHTKEYTLAKLRILTNPLIQNSNTSRHPPRRRKTFSMPQYDAYEDPVVEPKPLTNIESSSKPLAIIHDGDLKDASNHLDSQSEQFHSPLEFHQRHSCLSREDWSEKKAIGSVALPEPDNAMSPKKLSPKEKQELAEFERSQKQDDEIRLILACGRGEQSDDRRKNHIGQNL